MLACGHYDPHAFTEFVGNQRVWDLPARCFVDSVDHKYELAIVGRRSLQVPVDHRWRANDIDKRFGVAVAVAPLELANHPAEDRR